jgi:hypothetical protein
VRTGLNLKFQSKPQLKERIEEVMYEGEKRKAMAKWMREMLRERHIMKVPEEEEVARPTMFWIRSFLTWSSSQWRQVFDLKELNSHLVVPTFSQESLRGVSKKISRMQWAFKADASKMFWHIAVDPKWRPFLRFRYRGATYECASMPLGLATAPFICQQLMSRLHKYLWDKGINAIFYVDDWLILGDNKPKTALMAQLFVTEMANFGIHLNLKKTMTALSQRFAFLGINFDLAKRRIMVPTEKLRDLERAASRLLDRECVSARELQSFLGKTNFVAIATVFTKLKVYMTANKAYYDSDLGRAHNYIWTKYNSGVAIVSNTVSSDSRKMMELAGINVRVYGAATIRHAAISKWRMMGLPRERVAERTFHRSLNIISFYYDKSVITDLNASLVTERGRDAVYFDEMEESEEEFWMEDG